MSRVLVAAEMSAPVFTEDWFSAGACELLANLVARTDGLRGDVVEVGSWEGKSTIALANAVSPAVVHAVDTWLGSPGEVSAELAAERDVLSRFMENVQAATNGNVVAHRTGWRAYFADHQSAVRFCFIDAEHTFEEVRDNIAAVLPLLEPGGIICGDDIHHDPVRRAVAQAFADAKCDGPVWWWQKPASRLEEEYRRRCVTPSDIFEHLPRFVDLVVERDAQHVIELGTRTGVSTIAWLYGLEQTGGRLTSVDIDAKPPIGNWDHWTFIQGNDCSREVLGQLDDADIVFLDTSHLYEPTLVELRVYQHLVKRPGLIVCHDTMLERPEGAPARPRFPVRTAIEEFCADEGFKWSNNPACWGLGEIEVI